MYDSYPFKTLTHDWFIPWFFETYAIKKTTCVTLYCIFFVLSLLRTVNLVKIPCLFLSLLVFGEQSFLSDVWDYSTNWTKERKNFLSVALWSVIVMTFYDHSTWYFVACPAFLLQKSLQLMAWKLKTVEIDFLLTRQSFRKEAWNVNGSANGQLTIAG